MIAILHSSYIAVLCVVLISGCVRPNIRYIESGSMSARAALQTGAAPLYHEVTITRPADDSAPRFCLRLLDGRIIDQASLTYNGLRQAGLKEVHRDYRRQYYDKRLGTHRDVSHEFATRGISCLFVGDTLVELLLRDDVAISREDEKRFYTLPLSQADLEQVFGPPDKVLDGHHW
ncbi:MAG: hypothetical protein K9N52_01195 [Verrucomicrobia bacterium]|nr:hypothetical protein [Verrucomicrobiota bacterium]